MSARRFVNAALVVIFVLSAALLVGCASEAQDATFIGYRQRPTEKAPEGVAIVRLGDGTPTEATCIYKSLENGTPIKVEKSGDTYEVVATSPDWE